MKPTLSRIKKNSNSSTASSLSTIWSKDGGCPFGTVPVKRITKDDLIRQRRMPQPEDVTFNTQFDVIAIARTPNEANNRFAGVGMATSLYNPHVKDGQHSGSRLKIQKGSNILQVGWRVDPTLYGDTKTRLFIHFQVPELTSTLPFFLNKDLANGNWWLLLTRSFNQVGFWPQRIFIDLTSFATNVEWGGVAYSPPGVPKTPMGSSFFPIKNSSYDGYCSKITILNEKGKTIKVDETITHTDNPNMYQVFAEPIWHKSE
ncbi:protein neprosin-like [Lycium barbarum]|uniref:protein neprosin-like n=1 Tax=Lycium barbarum TaxID=112863 RepID=UPI00293E54A3|nr:protein neprosin-like [Lycium barbarum]